MSTSPSTDFSNLRELFGVLPPDEWNALARARELAHWTETNHFCGRCGTAMIPHPDPAERAFKCPACGFLAYPQYTPAIIVLVKKGDSILLQRNSHYKLPHWTLVAGFLDPVETFEDAVRREIREEASIEVSHIRYFGSQAWPFPSNIMVGFVADWVSGELRPDGDEVIESGWFTRDHLPSIPLKVSIARRLIDAWIDHRI